MTTLLKLPLAALSVYILGAACVIPSYADTAVSSDHALLVRLAAEVAADHATISHLQAQLTAKQSSAQAAPNTNYGPFTVTGTDVYLSGYNLHIQSGAGSTTASPNGLGNLIVGYNETRGGGKDVRTGSHNIILGTQNNYSSFAAVVGGFENNAYGPEASIIGGFKNTTTGHSSVIISGDSNNAGAHYTAIVGGEGNLTSGDYAVIGGGMNLSAAKTDSFLPLDTDITSIQGQLTTLQSTTAGLQTTVSSQSPIVSLFKLSSGVGPNTELTLSGINLHIVNGLGATDGNPSDPLDNNNDVQTNGVGNLILGYNETRKSMGSSGDVRTGSHNLILGSYNNYNSSFGGIVTGTLNETDGPWSSITGGSDNVASGYGSSISGGDYNIASADYASISGGQSNTASGDTSSISSGIGNVALAVYSSISGGVDNTTSGEASSIVGGSNNLAEGIQSSIGGGVANIAAGASFCSVVSGGANVEANGSYVFDYIDGTWGWDGSGPAWAATNYSGH